MRRYFMKVLYHSRGICCLLKDQDKYIIDVNSGRGAVGFTICVELSNEQEAAYLNVGESYLNELAEDIHQNQRTYFEREIDNDRKEVMHTAIMQWQEENGINYTK